MDCRNCLHYQLFKMISGNQPYGYSGDIPCLRCKWFGKANDEFVPIKETKSDE